MKIKYHSFKLQENVMLNTSVIQNGKHYDRGIDMIITKFTPNFNTNYRHKFFIECIVQTGETLMLRHKDIIKSKNNWVITDPDCNQWGRQLRSCKGLKLNLFEFSELRYNGSCHELYRSGIDPSAFDKEELESIVNSYGYTLGKTKGNLVNLKKQYGKDADWIKAECIFEQEN